MTSPVSAAGAGAAEAGAAEALVGEIVELALRLANSGSSAEAQSLYESAAMIDGGGPRSLYLRAELLRLRQEPEAALDAFDRAIAAGSRDPRCYLGRSQAILEAGDPPNAAASCQAALELFPDDSQLLAFLGALFRKSGRLDEARELLMRAVSSSSPAPAAHGELAMALMAAGLWTEAAESYRRALTATGADVSSHHVRAYALSRPENLDPIEAGVLEVVAPRNARAFEPSYEPLPRVCKGIPCSLPAARVTAVRDADILVGRDLVMTSDGRALLEAATRRGSERTDLVMQSTPYVDCEGVLVDAPRGDPLDSAVLLDGFGSVNYFHWLVDFLPRLLLLERAGVDPSIPLVVDGRVAAQPQLRDALAAVDTARRPVVPLDPYFVYRVHRLVVPSSLSWIVPNLRDHLPLELGDSVLDPEAIAFLRARLVDRDTEERDGTRLVYVARRPRTTLTRLVNEAEVRDAFEAAGFDIVMPDTLSFAEQRALFAEAAVVAGESGAGLTNMLLAPRSTILMCLQAERWSSQVYADLSGALGQRATFVVGDVQGERPRKPYQARFTLDRELLRKRIDVVLRAASRRQRGKR